MTPFFMRHKTPADAMLPCAALLARSPSTNGAALVRVLAARKDMGRDKTIALLEMMLEVARK